MSIRPVCISVLAVTLLLSVNVTPGVAAEFRLDAEGLGPITVSMRINVRNAKDNLTAFPKKVAELTATARNETGQRIRYAEFCVQAERRTKGCDFRLRTGRVWEPGEELLWMVDGDSPRGIENARIMLVKLKRPKTKE